MVDTLRSHLVMSCVEEQLPFLVDAFVVFEEVVHVALGVDGRGVVAFQQPSDCAVCPPTVATILADDLPRFDLLAVPTSSEHLFPCLLYTSDAADE